MSGAVPVLYLGPAEDQIEGSFRAALATPRLPRHPGGAAEGLGAGAHTDHGGATLPATDGEPGLALRPRGSNAWIEAPHLPGAFVVNIGDCLERRTNGRDVSTPHRASGPARERERFSVAFFLDPGPEAEVAALPGTVGPGRPARRPPTTGAAHPAERPEATYAHRREDRA